MRKKKREEKSTVCNDKDVITERSVMRWRDRANKNDKILL